MGTNSTRHDRHLRDVGVRRFRQRNRPAAFTTNSAMMSVFCISDTQLFVGAVVKARVPFIDGADYKVRPAVVVAVGADGVELRACTSSQKGLRRRGHVLIADLAAAGLHRATAVRPESVLTDTTDIVGLYGSLSQHDCARILEATYSLVAA